MASVSFLGRSEFASGRGPWEAKKLGKFLSEVTGLCQPSCIIFCTLTEGPAECPVERARGYVLWHPGCCKNAVRQGGFYARRTPRGFHTSPMRKFLMLALRAEWISAPQGRRYDSPGRRPGKMRIDRSEAPRGRRNWWCRPPENYRALSGNAVKDLLAGKIGVP